MMINTLLHKIFHAQKITEPAPAYDWWAAGYDDQPGNLMLDLDEQVTGAFLENAIIKDKVVVDLGCGTGRHWGKIMALNPARLVGFDVSLGMLGKLRVKFPAAETFLLNGNALDGMEDESCDLLFSTLTVAHIPDLAQAFSEWNRVLKPGAEIFMTDYHPDALARGGERTFKKDGKTISIRNYVHPLARIRSIAGQLGWSECRFMERVIDESVKDFYVLNRALPIYEKFKGTPIIYALHFKKRE